MLLPIPLASMTVSARGIGKASACSLGEISTMVVRVLPKHETRVRFSYLAPRKQASPEACGERCLSASEPDASEMSEVFQRFLKNF